MQGLGGWGGGFMRMVYAVLGLVIIMTLFGTIMTGLTALLAVSGVSNFIAFTVVVGIAPTILLLGTIFVVGLAYRSGYKMLAVSDATGLLRMVFGVLEIILFVTLFATIAANFYTLYSTYCAVATWIAFPIVLTICPTILFLAGLFAGGSAIYGGLKAARGHKKGGYSAA